MSSTAKRRNYRGKHRLTKARSGGLSHAVKQPGPRISAALLATALLAPGALSLTNAATASAQAPTLGNWKVAIQGYDEQGRAIVHYNNRVNDPNIETAVQHLNSTPGLNVVLKPGTSRGAINISHERFSGATAGWGGLDGSGPYVKLDPKYLNWNAHDRTEIASHELLHALNLAHNNDPCSIMYGRVNRCNNGPTQLSRNEINQLNSTYTRGKPTNPSTNPTVSNDRTRPAETTTSTRPTDIHTAPNNPKTDTPRQNKWTPPEENTWNQTRPQNTWNQPRPQNTWNQPRPQNRWNQPRPQNTWNQPPRAWNPPWQNNSNRQHLWNTSRQNTWNIGRSPQIPSWTRPKPQKVWGFHFNR